MKIQQVEIKNFRAIRDESITLDDLTAIVGANGAGKSTFLHAIALFYNLTTSVNEEDYFDKNINVPIEIRVTFANLRDDELEEFGSFIRDGKLIVTERISFENGRYYQKYFAAPLQIPEFAKIRNLPRKMERRAEWNSLVESGKFKDLEKAKSADIAERMMNDYEEENQSLKVPIEMEVQFVGPKNIGGGKLDNYTKFVIVPAVKEASDETTERSGAIYKLLDMIVARKINSRADIIEFKSEFEQKIKELYGSDNLKELPELGSSISNTLEKFAPGSKLNLTWDTIDLPEVKLPKPIASLTEDNFEGEISRKGHGLQRALVLTLLQHLAVVEPFIPIKDEDKDHRTGHNLQADTVNLGPDLILAIEEPELYLHPSRCRYLSNILLRLSSIPDMGLGTNNQVLYTTHSPHFIDLYRFNQIRKVSKDTTDGSDTKCCKVTKYTLEDAKNYYADICNEKQSEFLVEGFRARSFPIMNTIVNEGFFSEKVVVVEGLTEIGVLWKMQEIMKKNWEQQNIVIIPAGGKRNIDKPTIIFRGFKIPTYFIFDSDSHLKGKNNEKDTINSNHRLLRLGDNSVVDFPETIATNNFAVFNPKIEDVIKESIGQNYYADLTSLIASELGYDSPSRVEKNIEGASQIIEKSYNDGKRIPVLEEIVEFITNL